MGDAHQEHGAIVRRDLPFEALPIGARLRITPNRICMTAAMYGRYHIVNGDDAIVDVWERNSGWEVSPVALTEHSTAQNALVRRRHLSRSAF